MFLRCLQATIVEVEREALDKIKFTIGLHGKAKTLSTSVGLAMAAKSVRSRKSVCKNHRSMD